MNITDINQALSSAVCSVRAKARERSSASRADVRIDADLGKVPLIFAHEAELRRALANIIRPMQALADDGAMLVRTRTEKDSVVVEMFASCLATNSESWQESFFSPFPPNDLSRDDFGVFMARLVIARHGGSVEIQNQARYAVVLIRLPAIDGKQTQETAGA
jgi:nitrogen-specific signal transduction histidine kinase